MLTTRRLLLSVILVLSSSMTAVPAEGDIATLQPRQPAVNATMSITYNTAAPGAKLGGGDDIYAVLSYWRTDHGLRRSVALMQRSSDGTFRHSQAVPADAAALTIWFTTATANDEDATIQTMIHRPDGVPVRTAWEQSMLSRMLPRDYKERFAHEMALYPDNLAAYRNKWFVAGAYDRATVQATIERDMRLLRRRVKGEPIEGLYALSCGYILLGQEGEARTLLRRMVALYPRAPLTAAALSAYSYQAYAQHWQAEGRDEVVALTHQVILADPGGRTAHDDMAAFAYNTTLPLDALEAIAEGWMKEEPDNPLPAFHLAHGYERRDTKLEQAAPLARRAVEGMLRGMLRPYADVSGSMTEFYLPDACLLAARIEMKLEHPALALGYAKTAQAVAKETNAEAWLAEGEAWAALHNAASAERAYIEAHRRGSKEAEEALRADYLRRNGAPDGFETHLNALMGRSGAGASTRNVAPGFKVVSADGTAFDSEALKGKVMVLNFWSTGCGPCKAEIPDLNQLVERFRGKDVVFLALSGEDGDALGAFLEKHPFAYQVIPRASAVFRSYDIDSLPVHVVVGREGEVVARLGGAGEQRAGQIGRLVDRALAE